MYPQELPCQNKNRRLILKRNFYNLEQNHLKAKDDSSLAPVS